MNAVNEYWFFSGANSKKSGLVDCKSSHPSDYTNHRKRYGTNGTPGHFTSLVCPVTCWPGSGRPTTQLLRPGGDHAGLVVVIVAVEGDGGAVRAFTLGGGQAVGDGVVQRAVEVDDAEGSVGDGAVTEQGRPGYWTDRRKPGETTSQGGAWFFLRGTLEMPY